VKKFSPAFVLLIVSFLLVFFSCKRINEATTLGGDLIPVVDNVNTFEVALNTVTTNALYNDTVKVAYTDPVALGDINDPEFGKVHANFGFSLSAASYGTYPFLPRMDTTHTIDSVVLSLSFAGAYGDTIGNGVQTISVFEIDPNAGFRSDSSYRYKDPASDFSGSFLGNKIYTIRTLGTDSTWFKEPGDTVIRKAVNILRIKLNNSLGSKLAAFDTASNNLNAGFLSDSAFKKLFPGLAVKSSNTGNALAYFNLTDQTNTRLTVYYHYKKGSTDTTAAVSFTHLGYANFPYLGGQANYVNVQPGNNWAAALNNPASDKVYIQSAPSGAYASIVIPELTTFGNKVIHRAEIIATHISSTAENAFTPPPRLLLDRIHKDSVYLFEKDLVLGTDGSIGYDVFGGTVKDNSYRFNITRYVQGIVTRHDRNDTLRLWAPLRASEYSTIQPGSYLLLPVNNRVAAGRVVLAGGSYADPKTRLRLRIVYSNL
jgi:Domain of unknown function (DUF4270)